MNLTDACLLETYTKALELDTEIDPAFIDLLYAEICKRNLDEKVLCASNADPMLFSNGDF